MDRALFAVLGGAVGCGALLALAVLKNERTFTERLYAGSPGADVAVGESARAALPTVAPAPEKRWHPEPAAGPAKGPALQPGDRSARREAPRVTAPPVLR